MRACVRGLESSSVLSRRALALGLGLGLGRYAVPQGYGGGVYDVDFAVSVEVCQRIPVGTPRDCAVGYRHRGGVDDVHLAVHG